MSSLAPLSAYERPPAGDVTPYQSEARPFMPFRSENIMSTLLIAAVVLLALMGVFGAVSVAIWGRGDSTPTIVYIGGLILLSVKVLLGMLQTEASRRDLANRVAVSHDDIKHELSDAKQAAVETKVEMAQLAKHTNGELTNVVNAVAEQTRAAEREQVLPDVLHSPEFADLLDRVASAAVKKYCAEKG